MNLSRSGPQVSSRFDGIDLLRGLSILAVILLHGSLRLRHADTSLEPHLPRWLFHLLFWNGNNGVTMFFAISGFLITTTSIRRFGDLAHFRVKQFYRFRFARIGPLLLSLLAVLSFLHAIGASGFVIPAEKASLPRALLSALTFHVNWLEAQRGYLPSSWDVLWSLSVEETFYLLFPFACLITLRLRHGLAIFISLLLVFVAMGPLARTRWAFNEIWQEKSYLGGMDAIALGCLSALLVHSILPRRRVRFSALFWYTVQMIGVAMLLLVAIWPRWDWMRFLGYTGLDASLLALGTCLTIIPSVLRGRAGGSWSAPLRWLGRNSYEIYLTHEFIVIWGTAAYLKWPRCSQVFCFMAIVALSAILGDVVARYFSEPLNRALRNRASTPAVST